MDAFEIMLVGGRALNQSPQRRTYKLDTSNLTTLSVWSKGPFLHEERYGHSCGTFQIGSSKYVIVAGGAKMVLDLYLSIRLDTVEMLKMGSDQNRWVPGATLPKKTFLGSQLLAIQSSLLMVHQQSLFEMKCPGPDPKDCHWREAPGVWQTPMVNPQLFIMSNLKQGPTFCQ